ncbi:hypothetical protein D3C71_1203790 [compost metagenome]
MHADAVFGQRHGHGVDQERHVVIDDLQHGVRRFPTVGLQARVEHADIGLARLADARELQRVGCQRGPLLGGVVRELVRLHALVEVGGKRHCLGLPGRRVALAQGRVHRLQREAHWRNSLRIGWFGFVFHGLGCWFLRFHDGAVRDAQLGK